LKRYVVLSHRVWNRELASKLTEHLGVPFHLISKREDLTVEHLRELNPRYVFVAHWSYRIPDVVFNEFECIIFHMTDVPYGRGGSPLQNLILRGHRDTVVSALRCIEEMDAGAVYSKKPLPLHGSAEEIYGRANDVIHEMICDIVLNEPTPQPQEGEVTAFVRRRPEESELPGDASVEDTYDFIRMLDANGYPRAFIQHGGLRIEFCDAEFLGDAVSARVLIRPEGD
jgi:methionyl-tRNA formyltransferase